MSRITETKTGDWSLEKTFAKKSLRMALTPGRRVYPPSQLVKVEFPVQDPHLSKKKGKVFVDKSEILEDILDAEALESTRHIRLAYLKPLGNGYSGSPQQSNEMFQHQLMKDRRAQDAYVLDRALKINVQKAVQSERAQKDKLFNHLVTQVDSTRDFLDDVDKTLSMVEETKRNKTRRQFEDWNIEVHGKIQENILLQKGQLKSKELNKKKNEDYSKFLDITNRKASIFRDIIIESEYDPLEPNRRAIKAKTGRLTDPTHIEIQKAEEENSMLKTGPKSLIAKPIIGRETLGVELWATGKIEATPFGCFANMMSTQSHGSNETEMKKQAMRSSKVTFDHFNYPYGKEALDREMPLGKKTVPHHEMADTNSRVFNM